MRHATFLANFCHRIIFSYLQTYIHRCQKTVGFCLNIMCTFRKTCFRQGVDLQESGRESGKTTDFCSSSNMTALLSSRKTIVNTFFQSLPFGLIVFSVFFLWLGFPLLGGKLQQHGLLDVGWAGHFVSVIRNKILGKAKCVLESVLWEVALPALQGNHSVWIKPWGFLFTNKTHDETHHSLCSEGGFYLGAENKKHRKKN